MSADISRNSKKYFVLCLFAYHIIEKVTVSSKEKIFLYFSYCFQSSRSIFGKLYYLVGTADLFTWHYLLYLLEVCFESPLKNIYSFSLAIL